MNKEKQHLTNLQKEIDQKQKELKRLRDEYETVFSDISKSWWKQMNTSFPNLQPCNIGEYVGVDVVYEGRTYNLFIAKERQKLICMFSYDRKDRSTYDLTLKDAGKELVDKLNALFTENPAYKSSCFYTGHGYYKNFKKEDFEDAFNFFLEVVKAFTSH